MGEKEIYFTFKTLGTIWVPSLANALTSKNIKYFLKNKIPFTNNLQNNFLNSSPQWQLTRLKMPVIY